MSQLSINDLPYNLPENTQERLNKLAQITAIPKNLLIGAGEKEVEAICYMIAFRHLNQKQREDGLRLFNSLEKKALTGFLIDNAIYTAFVNSQWGIWSLTNEELEADIRLHRKMSTYAAIIGVGASVSSAKDMIKNIMEKKRVGVKNWVTLVIYGCIIFNEVELYKAETEKNHRTTLNTSRLFK